MDENYFTVSQVAEKLKVKNSTIWRWIRLGKLNCVCIGRNYRISQSDIDKFLQQEKS